MKTLRSLAIVGLACISAAALAGCAAAHGPADRTDEFIAADKSCIGSWWLGDLRDGTSDEARLVAEHALAEADVTTNAWDAATSLLDMSMNDDERRRTTMVDLESESYILAVTLHVKDELDAAGYPDIDRVIDIWSERSCS